MRTLIIWDHSEEAERQGVILHDGVEIGIVVWSEGVCQVTNVQGIICYQGHSEERGVCAAIEYVELGV
jgi:hypothetical protein